MPALPTDTGIDVTVLIATFNRGRVLARTLTRLRELDTTGLTWQLIIVDNGSTDDTAHVLASAARTLPLLALHHAERGKNRALNAGFTHARGALIVFTDDDVLPDVRWLAELRRAAADWPGHHVFAGQIVPTFPDGTPGWLRDHPFGMGAFARFQPDKPEGPIEALPFGGNFAVRAASVGGVGFNELIGPVAGTDYVAGSETEYLLRLKRAGHTPVYVPTARVEHVIEPEQTTHEWLMTRCFRIGRGMTRLGLAYRFRPPCVFGVPAYLIPHAGKTWLRYLFRGLLGQERRFDAELRYQFLRGGLRELRQMARDGTSA